MTRWLLVGAMFAVGCSKGPSEEQCKQLLEHLVDLEFKAAGTQATDAQKADIAKQKIEVAKAKPDFVDVCVNKTAKSRVECSLKATDLAGVLKCDDSK